MLKIIEVGLHSNPEGYGEIAEVYAEKLGVDWDENDDRWAGIYGLKYETILEVTIDTETGNVVWASVL